MPFRNKNILIISPSPWDVSFPARQHYARELAKSGAFVYYLNPPSKADSKIELSENLWVVDYKLNGGFMGLFKLSEANLSEKINKLIDKKIDIIWSFDCNRFRDLNMFGSDSYKIYTKEIENSVEYEINRFRERDFIWVHTNPIVFVYDENFSDKTKKLIQSKARGINRLDINLSKYQDIRGVEFQELFLFASKNYWDSVTSGKKGLGSAEWEKITCLHTILSRPKDGLCIFVESIV
jgi:hypothetical protein